MNPESGTSGARRRLVRRALDATRTGARIPAVPRDRKLPLSFAQQRLWVLDQLHPGSPTYNVPLAIRLRGSLDLGVLQRALDAVVARHEALRTTFVSMDGGPVQVIADRASVALPVVDLSRLPEPEREAESRRLLYEEARQLFDLSGDLMLRALLVRLSQSDHALLLTMHHIVSDGWSENLLFQDLWAFYNAFSTGRPPSLPELPIQYADFAVWQRDWLQGEVLEKQLSYWRQHLAGAPEVLDVPTDLPRPAIQTFRGAWEKLSLLKDLTEALQALSQREGATLYMTLLAAFQVLLHRYTAQEEIVVGSPIAGRDRKETEGLIGFFVNTLVMRGDLSGDPTFREFLGRVREAALGAFENQDLPFERLVKELQPERDLARTPLFQEMLVLQNAHGWVSELSGVTLSPMWVDTETSKFDMTLFLQEEADGLLASLEYNADLFDAGTMKRLLGHYKTLLESVVRDAGQRVSGLPLLTEAERRRFLEESNEGEFEYPEEETLHGLIEAQVERTPEAVALVCGENSVTYRELNVRANQLACHLRQCGIGPGGLVGICIDRSVEMVVAILGVLKAGGAYVPLDPAYPEDRLAYILRDAGVKVLLAQERLAHRPGEGDDWILVCIDRDAEAIARGPSENLEGGAAPSDLAYVIYTSGSTGRPKGVMVEHRNVISMFAAMDRSFGAEPPGVWLAVTTISFDISVLELFWPLTKGSRVVIHARDDGAFSDPGEKYRGESRVLSAEIRQHGVTHLQCTPSLGRMLVADPEALEALRSLKHLLIGGEAFPPALARQMLDSLSGDLWNMYGPTEATIWSTSHRVREAGRTVSIGRPLANSQVHLVDAHGNPVPAGVRGELCIGGAGVARGYLNRPELTAERFVPDSFSGKPGARLYKTGDLARYSSDGNIEFLGRLDHQVKVRGFRIELGEVEAELSQHPAVRETVVVVREDAPGEARLVAYLVVDDPEAAASATDWRSFLSRTLPEYMLPSVYFPLAELPRTPNGKVDRKALPAPDPARRTAADAFVAPRTQLEEALSKIWSSALAVDAVGVNDNFFDLGGHSLSAVNITFRIRETFHVELPLQTFLQAPTIAGLAEQIESRILEQAEDAELDGLLGEIEGLSEEDTRSLAREARSPAPGSGN